MKSIRVAIASLFTLGILMYIAFLLGKSLEGFIHPVIVWLLLAVAGFRSSLKDRRSDNSSKPSSCCKHS